MRERLVWIGLGLLGLVAAAAIGLAASKVTDAPIGLSAEPVSAGEALAPKRTATPRPRRRATPTATATSAPTATVDDDGGDDDSGGRGRGRGRSDDDD
jgi:hypothetical protein